MLVPKGLYWQLCYLYLGKLLAKNGATMQTEEKVCPICGNRSHTFSIDSENLHFLTDMIRKEEINTVLSMARIVWKSIPNTAKSKTLVDELSKMLIESTQEQLNKILEPMRFFAEEFPRLIEKLPEDLRTDVKREFNETQIRFESQFKMLSLNIKEVLKEMGFPEPEQLKLLTELVPSMLPLLNELLRNHRVPAEKGKQGELELIEQLREYFPDDECEPVGGPGDTDILAIPRFNGLNLTYKILVESKKNGSGWNRSFIQQTRTHMKLRGERFAILAVDIMPKGANGFLFDQCPEGVVLVTDREYFRVAYGSLRASIIALQPFCHKEVDFGRLFADQKISEVVKEAYDYCEWVKRIKEKARRIEANADGINQDIVALDKHLRRVLSDLQTRINNAITQIASTEHNPLLSTSGKAIEVSSSGK